MLPLSSSKNIRRGSRDITCSMLLKFGNDAIQALWRGVLPNLSLGMASIDNAVGGTEEERLDFIVFEVIFKLLSNDCDCDCDKDRLRFRVLKEISKFLFNFWVLLLLIS
ncbi:hypothetical protein FRACYDRAFT_238402 [Fragilariopsis cylindrus CCMP1102]|uniref:Uncharacterized protein n=1 Tax=Fragilariopsis cylindrus CCMP1102 TaxID=635003 RepID=A0A1E7FIG6_9STRA|nr:hypothetical protein FRACYDRAFT_238402 [Fragilariopsis cylindrus CCMP1102]|eukprot:OEU17971.1 hypothetical protein FRACYDRAFT_238402 [Fragilariopsis cylindrus CCMP1102]